MNLLSFKPLGYASKGAICALAFVAVLAGPAAAQEVPDKATSPKAATRPCAATATPAAQPTKSSKPKKKKTASEPIETIAVCLEVQSPPLEIQEFLQAFVRDQGWKVGEGQVSEDSWMFVRYLAKDEMAQVAKTDILGGRIMWKEGKAVVHVMTTEVSEGFTRVQISARFQGRGQTPDQFEQPSDFWPLASKGTLEGSMIAALENRFHPLR
jgi:hypothetical protein